MASVSILSIGNELLIGDTINTNASRIGAELTDAGFIVNSVRVVGDCRNSLTRVIHEEWSRVDILLLTGGLGPTHDDLTKEVLAELFCTKMKVDERVKQHILSIFENRKLPVYPSNLAQAEIPECFEVLFNPHGTAPGMLLHKDNKVLVALPGVPYEMIYLLTKEVIPRMQKIFSNLTSRAVHYMKTAGEAESVLSEELIGDISSFLSAGCELAFLPGPARVTLRISSTNADPGKANLAVNEFRQSILGKIQGLIYSEEKDETLEQIIGKILKDKSLTLCTAESCTGGGLLNRLTDTPGSSAYVETGYVVYSNESKGRELGVDAELIEQFGAVSKEVVLAMAEGAANRSGADVAIALSGVAGPGGGTKEKPVGLVWMALKTPEELFALRLLLTQDRLINKERSIIIALETLRRTLLGIKRLPYGLEKQA